MPAIAISMCLATLPGFRIATRSCAINRPSRHSRTTSRAHAGSVSSASCLCSPALICATTAASSKPWPRWVTPAGASLTSTKTRPTPSLSRYIARTFVASESMCHRSIRPKRAWRTGFCRVLTCSRSAARRLAGIWIFCCRVGSLSACSRVSPTSRSIARLPTWGCLRLRLAPSNRAL